MCLYSDVHLGKLKGLSALNLDGNPLEHPPLEILKHGIKAIQQYLRDEHIRRSKCAHEKLDTDDETYDEERSIDMVADVWASSDDEQTGQRRLARSQYPSTRLSRPLLLRLQKSKYFVSTDLDVLFFRRRSRCLRPIHWPTPFCSSIDRKQASTRLFRPMPCPHIFNRASIIREWAIRKCVCILQHRLDDELNLTSNYLACTSIVCCSIVVEASISARLVWILY